MTDTPSSGAGADARVLGAPAASEQLDVVHLSRPLPLSDAEAETVFAPQVATAPGLVTIEASALKPQLLGLLRWALTLFAAGLVQRGLLSRDDVGQLVTIGSGVPLAAGTAACSWDQKRLAARRIRDAAAADPAKVVLR